MSLRSIRHARWIRASIGYSERGSMNLTKRLKERAVAWDLVAENLTRLRALKLEEATLAAALLDRARREKVELEELLALLGAEGVTDV